MPTSVLIEGGQVEMLLDTPDARLQLADQDAMADHAEFETQYAILKPGSRRFLVST